MDLMIEHGMLLKPYIAPYISKLDAHRKPLGWAPERHAGIMAAAEEIVRQADGAIPLESALQVAEDMEGKRLVDEKKPWPGWIPINPKIDPRISKAYRRLFASLNPNRPPDLRTLKGEKVEWPMDGHYIFSKGEMELVGG